MARSTQTLAPQWLTGIWRRDSLVFANGKKDIDSLVLWGQTPSRFVDLRLPVARLAAHQTRRGAKAEISLRAQQEGFAGWVELEKDVCRWHREIDFQPSNGIADQARLRIERNQLFEDALDDVDGVPAYKEVFTRTRPGLELCVGFDLIKLEGSVFGTDRSVKAIMVIIGDAFLFARDRQTPVKNAPSLVDALKGATKEDVKNALDCEISFGSLQAGKTAWHIKRSTRPEREGKRLFEPSSKVTWNGSNLTVQSKDGRAIWRSCDAVPAATDISALFSL
jgi:hypothetical protein